MPNGELHKIKPDMAETGDHDMARNKHNIAEPDLSNPPDKDDFFDALKQILTPTRNQVKGENRTPTSNELNAKYRLARRKSTA